MSNEEPGPSSGTVDTTDNSIAHHALRKRHSPNAAASLRKEEATSVASSSGNAAKLRKVTGSAHPSGDDSNKSRHAIPSHHHRRNNELRYLKDFFPERSPQILTRSRTRQAPSSQSEKPTHAEDDASPRSPHGSLSKDKYRRYRNVPGGSSSTQKKPPDAPASSANKTEARDDAAEVQESMASVLQYATEEVHRHLGEISSGMQGAAGSGLLTRADAPSSSMRFDLTGLSSTPTVIMSMPSSDHSTFHSSFAQLAAAVAGGSTDVPGTSSSAATGNAASCTSSSMAGPSSSGRAAASGFVTKAGVPLSFASKSQPMHRASAFLGSLVPRMQHLLGGGGMGGGGGHLHSNLRGMSILEGLRSQNEIRQSEAAGELAEMLLLGNEESLPHLPVREILQCLMALLQKAHNFELMLTAARCITNMQEALPRALPIIMDAVPLLLQKLKRIECIDVAEQSLIALEVMSRRNAKSILAAGGISATIAHVDFFSLPSQRLAFQIAANCASFITVNDFQLIRDCIPDLTQRLNVDDKRCVESICTFFNRVIENMRNNAEKLREIAGPNYDLVKNFQQLLTIQPSTVSSNTFLSILKSLRYMCTKCGDIAVALIKADFGLTVRFLLVNSDKKQTNTVDVAARPPQQLREIVELIGELMPVLPKQKMFEVNPVVSQYVNPNSLFRSKFAIDFVAITWHYMDHNGDWAAFGTNEAGILEQAKNTSQDIEQFDFGGQIYEVDFMRMIRRNIMTGAESRIERRIASAPVISSTKSSASAHEPDERETLKQTNNEIFLDVISMLFPLLVDIGTTSTCSSLRYESLLVMMRMIYAVESENELKKVLENVPLASYIASTLSGNKGIGVVATAIQLVRVLLDKLPYLYVPLFEAEGVFHELKKLASSKSSRRASHSSRSHKSKTHGSSSSSHHKKDSIRRVPPPPATGTTNASVVVHGSTASSAPSHSLRSHPTPTAPASSSSSAAPSSSTAVQAATLPPGALTVPISNTFVPPELLLSRGVSMFQNLHQFIPSLTMANSAPFVYVGSSSMQQASSSSQAAGSSSAASSSAALRQCLTERIQEFIASEAKEIISLFTGENGVKYGATSNESVFEELCRVAAQLSIKARDVGCEPLKTLKSILLEKDVSAFQLNHSGITIALNNYLSDSVSFHPPRKLRLKRFAAIFMSLQPDNLRPADEDSFGSFAQLVNKVVLAIGQLEQFQVKVTNLSGISTTGVGGSSSAIASTTFLRGAQALRFFQTHQIRCNLKRHSTCNRLREWRHGRGSIKVDPFTSVSAIERYLIDRGIGLNGGGDDSSDNEDLSDEDQELSNSSSTSFSGRIEIFIGDNKLPSDISILQAIRQYALPQEDDDQETIPSSIWITAHTLYYRAVETPAEPEPKDSAQQEPMDQDAAPSNEPSGSSSTPPLRKIARIHRAGATPKKDKKVHAAVRPTIFQDGQAPKRPCPLEGYLSSGLPTVITDPSLECLILLRSLYGLNQYWWALFQEDDDIPPPSSHAALLPASAFHSSKLNSKVSRQLSDFLSVATQQVPAWTGELVRAVPFAFPFMTRRNLLYCTAFGRDRALMHLVNEANGEEHEGESASRLIPRLERRKVSISRNNLIKDAQHTMTQMGGSRAMLEVGFDGEVGTGFGPTLEFYSTLSRELQKYSLKLWSGAPQKDDVDNESEEYVHNASGLYPMIHRHSTTKQLESRLKKFEFFGRLLAQALIDSRMLDLPLSSPFFKWLLADEHTLGLHDLEMLEPGLYQSLRNIASMKTAEDFEALELYFTYPGDESFELVDGGKKMALVKENMRQFIELVCYWRLVEGVRPEMEAVRKGFDLVVTNTDLLKIFTADEMEALFCGCSENDDEKIWSKSALQQALRPDHGYTHESAQIGWLVDMLQSYSKDKRRKFLQFVTGSPRLPVGGFRALNPPLTVVRKTASYGNSENELPSAMTCYNYLKIPPYATYETFVERFDVALQFIYSFHLT